MINCMIYRIKQTYDIASVITNRYYQNALSPCFSSLIFLVTFNLFEKGMTISNRNNTHSILENDSFVATTFKFAMFSY